MPLVICIYTITQTHTITLRGWMWNTDVGVGRQTHSPPPNRYSLHPPVLKIEDLHFGLVRCIPPTKFLHLLFTILQFLHFFFCFSPLGIYFSVFQTLQQSNCFCRKRENFKERCSAFSKFSIIYRNDWFFFLFLLLNMVPRNFYQQKWILHKIIPSFQKVMLLKMILS